MNAEGHAHDTRIRVRYGEVDRMGVVYHGHYLVYFEQGRTELLRSLGATYRQVEEEGTLLFVVETGLTFHRPAHYDDELLVRTRLASVRGVRLRFEYEVLRDGLRLTTGFTVLAACDADGRPRRIPERLARLTPSATGSGSRRKAGAARAVQGDALGDAGEGPARGDA